MYIEMFSKWNCAKHQTGPLPQRSLGLRAMAEQSKRNKGSREPDEVGLVLFGFFRGGGTGGPADWWRGTACKMHCSHKGTWRPAAHAPRNRWGMISENQGNHEANTREGEKVWLFAFAHEQSDFVRRGISYGLALLLNIPSDSTQY